MAYLLVLASITFLTGGQLFQKLAANKAASLPGERPFVYRLFQQTETWWAIACLATGTMIWLLVLYQMEVSKAFPFLSLNFVIINLVSQFYLKEHISMQRWMGVVLITLGTAMVSLS